MPRLHHASLADLPSGVQRPRYDLRSLGRGNRAPRRRRPFTGLIRPSITDDAIAARGGEWGILGVSLRQAAVADALAGQDQLYTVETLSGTPAYRIIGAIRDSLCAPAGRAALHTALASPQTHIVHSHCHGKRLLPRLRRDIGFHTPRHSA